MKNIIERAVEESIHGRVEEKSAQSTIDILSIQYVSGPSGVDGSFRIHSRVGDYTESSLESAIERAKKVAQKSFKLTELDAMYAGR